MTRTQILFRASTQGTAEPLSNWGTKVLAVAACTLFTVSACGGPGNPRLEDADWTRAQRLESLLSTLAADSMEGRRTGTSGAHRAADFLAAELCLLYTSPSPRDS